MRKKILTMFLAAAMLTSSMAACGTPDDAGKTDGSNTGTTNDAVSTEAADKKATAESTGDEVKIQFMHQQVEQERQDAVAAIISDFEAANPGIKVEQIPTNEDDFDTKITTLGGSGQLPAVIEFSQDQAKTSVTNEFIDLESNKKVIEGKGVDAYFDGALEVIKTEDGNDYVGVPVSGWVQGIWINTKMIEEKGFEIPKTWEEVKAIAEAFYDPDNKKYGISLPTSESAFTEQVFSQFALSNGANVFDSEGGITVDTPEMKEAVAFYKELASYSMPGSTEVADVKDAFISQNAPMCMYSTYILGAVQEAGFLQDVQLALPTNKQAAAYGCIIVLSIASGLDDAQKEAAEKFVTFMMEKENNEKWLLMAPGGIQPVMSEVAEDPAYSENEGIVPFAHLLEDVSAAFDNLALFGCVEGKNFMTMGDITNTGALSKMVNQVVVQNADVEKEVKAAQTSIEGLVK